jgi:hypothetical protein
MPEIRQNGKKPSAVDSGKLADQLKMRLRRNFVNEVARATSKKMKLVRTNDIRLFVASSILWIVGFEQL